MSEIVITKKENPISIKLKKFLHDADDYELALTELSMYFSVPNVDTHNNIFSFRFNENQEFINVELPIGAYEIDEIITSIMNEVEMIKYHRLRYENEVENDSDIITTNEIFRIIPDVGKMKTYVRIMEKGFEIDFNCENSIGKIFGFNKIIGYGWYESENIINIQDLNTILVHCDIIDGALHNGDYSQILYSFSPSVPHGYMINEKKVIPTYYPIQVGTVHKIVIKLTDQNSNLLNTRDENITITLSIRKRSDKSDSIFR